MNNQNIECPRCGAQEEHPTDAGTVLIRGLKHFIDGVGYSQCLVCSGGYDENLVFTESNHNVNEGWFNKEGMV